MQLELFGKKVLLLQGPVGPFFARLSRELRQSGVETYKINFNGGDVLFHPGPHATSYRSGLESWPAFLEGFVQGKAIDTIVLFGDCRPYHRRAVEVANTLGKRVLVFEEGYLRPNFITLEEGGTNYHSVIPERFSSERPPNGSRRAVRSWPQEQAVSPSFFYWSAIYAILYAIGERAFAFHYPKYEHHKDLTLWRQCAHWFRGTCRRVYYGITERKLLSSFVGRLSKRYFLVALQVHDDYQVKNSEFGTVETFAERVVASFAAHAPPQAELVFKHHPMDRAHTDYTQFLARLAARHGLESRLHYVHDLPLPELLKHARGTVAINSTVGLSSLYHNTPVFCASRSVYGPLARSGSLDAFWRKPGTVDARRVFWFRSWLRNTCQANGSFYGRLKGTSNPTGVLWAPAFQSQHAVVLAEQPGRKLRDSLRSVV